MPTTIVIESRLPVRWGAADIAPFLGGKALAQESPIEISEHQVTLRLAEPATEQEVNELVQAFNAHLAANLVKVASLA